MPPEPTVTSDFDKHVDECDRQAALHNWDDRRYYESVDLPGWSGR